ncbi:hypothetical protein BSU00_06545 [Tenacibaculum sp. SG-28]|nr:hypothetical protein BSU00_06545 [Tenacibaculum sp. SG-28]
MLRIVNKVFLLILILALLKSIPKDFVSFRKPSQGRGLRLFLYYHKNALDSNLANLKLFKLVDIIYD